MTPLEEKWDVATICWHNAKYIVMSECLKEIMSKTPRTLLQLGKTF